MQEMMTSKTVIIPLTMAMMMEPIALTTAIMQRPGIRVSIMVDCDGVLVRVKMVKRMEDCSEVE